MATASDLEEELVRLSAGAGESRRTVIDLTVERLRQMAHRMLRKYPGVGRFDSTDDILGNAAIRLHQSLHVVKPDSARKYWGFAALQIRRTLIDLARKYSGPEGCGANTESGNQFQIDEQVDDRCEPLNLESWAAFHTAVGDLPPEEREVFDLLFYDGLKQHEAAKLLGISLATLKRRWLAARLILQEKHDGDFLD